MIIDTSKKRRSVRDGFVRSKESQSRYLSEMLGLDMGEPISAAFIFQFAGYNLPTDDPRFDLDMAGYGIVKVLPEGREATSYPGMPWEPKLSFRTIADLYTC